MEKLKNQTVYILKYKWRQLLLIAIFSLLFFVFFKDVLFFGKTFRGEPFAGGVVPSGPASYTGDRSFPTFLADPGATSWNDNPPFEIASEQIKNGYFPWWNPFNGTGTPVFADLLSSITFPLKWPLIFLANPFMFDLFSIVRLVIGIIFTYLFLRRLKVDPFIAVVSGFAFGVSGALIRYANMEHLSIDALIPFYIFSVEYFLQKRTRWAWFLLFASSLLAVLAAFPEANIFATAITVLYFLFRLAQEKQKVKIARDFIAANVLALLIAAPLLISFFQFVSQSWSAHPYSSFIGLSSVPLSILFSLVSPAVFDPKLTEKLGIIQFAQVGWVGGVVLTLGFLGIWTKGFRKSIGVFFSLYAIISLLKTFGIWPISLIGALPLLRQAIFPKYNQPAIAFSIVIASAIFLQYGKEKGLKLKHLLTGGLFVLFIFVTFFYQSFRLWFDLSLRGQFFLKINYLGTFTSFAFLFSLAAILILLLYLSRRQKFQKIAIYSILFLVVIEAVFNYPKHFPSRDKGYIPVSYVTELRKSIGEGYRASGKDEVLYPQVSGAYGVRDIRQLDAIYFKTYMDFLRIVDPKIYDRFTTLDENWIAKPQILRMLGVKNILTTTPLDEIPLSNLSQLGVPREGFLINNQSRDIYFLHPPIEKTVEITPPPNSSSVYFYLAMNPKVWDPSKGDGIRLQILQNGKLIKEVSIDPKNNPADRIWHKIEVPVSKSREVFEFKIDGEKSIDFDWVGMSDIYSQSLAEEIKNYYTQSSGFPFFQDGYEINSFEVKDPQKIAFFPERVKFVKKDGFNNLVEKSLNEIDKISVALSDKDEDLKQEISKQPQVEQKINGDIEVTLPVKFPKYLFISQPFHKDLSIKNQDNQTKSWFKANDAFILVSLNKSDKKIILKNSPTDSKKTIFILIASIGLLLSVSYFLSYGKFTKISAPKRKRNKKT